MPETRSYSLTDTLQRLNEVGIALSKESDPEGLLELIMLAAKDLTHADGGTMYAIEDGHLEFKIIRTDSIGIAMGGKSGQAIEFPGVPLYTEDQEPNMDSVVAHSVILGVTINIPDAYDAEGFDFSGTKAFDENIGYRSQSFLTVPMCNHEDEIIGVLQLINCINPETGDVQAFSAKHQMLAESLASQAAMTLTRNQLMDDMRNLFESFIKLIATAIDQKSPYTGGHCRRVPEITMDIAQAVCENDKGPLKAFDMTDEEKYALRIAGWLHDCGKVTTPEWIMDKATKLQTIFDRIELVEMRVEVLKRDAEIEKLHALNIAQTAAEKEAAKSYYKSTCIQLEADLDFIRIANIGGEFMEEADIQRIQDIGTQTLRGPHGTTIPLLSDDEILNLSIRKGTLTADEREQINHHIVATIDMLESLPYPKHLKRVPEFAGGHHERMDGKGYPRGLTRDEMSVEARIMGIADIFEALTARDRPYKEPMKLSTALTILSRMKLEGHIDPDIFDIFLHSSVWKDYADTYLDDAQKDDVDITTLPGYTALA